MANGPRFLYFLVWCGAVWGDRFIITPVIWVALPDVADTQVDRLLQAELSVK